MIDRAGIRRILEEHNFDAAHSGRNTTSCEAVNQLVRALVAENDKLVAEKKALTEALQKRAEL